jgi:hypothetical protein
MSAEEQTISLTDTCAREWERRAVADRRRHSWRTLTYCGLQGRGRRRQTRRSGQNYYLDHYAPGLVLTGALLMLLSSLDAAFTLTLLGKGAYEANQLMAWLLEISDHTFIFSKVAITAAGVLFLLAHAHFHIFRIVTGKRALELLVGIYGLLIGWELLLLGMIK